MSQNLIQYIKENPFFLAPMAGVTDKPFRSFMREMSCGIITTELVSARGIQDGNFKTRQLLSYESHQKPLGIQIFGEDLESIKYAVAYIEQEVQPDFIDLNLGCPVKKIVKKGAGSALLKDLKTLSGVLKTMRSNCSIPLSIKIRTGWDANSRNAEQVAQMAYDEGFSWVTIHGRTRAQAYSGQADWNYIKKIKQGSPIPIIGNGDIDSPEKAIESLQFSGCDGIMIGRGCLNDPWIFLDTMRLLQNKDKVMNKNFKDLIVKLQYHLEDFYDTRLFLLQLKKFASWFSSGFPKSTEFRKTIFQQKDKESVLEIINDFFDQHQNFQKPQPEYEPFLMQGHG